MAYTYSKIATYTVGSGGVPSVSFLNIPQNYTDLVLKGSVRNSGVTGILYFRVNNSTSSYSARNVNGNGTAANSATASVTDYLDFNAGNSGLTNYSGSTANTFSNLEMYIPNYTSSNYKSFSLDSVLENNATFGLMPLGAGLWSNTSPITSISIHGFNSSDSINQYSTFHLYGIKAEV